MLRILAFSDVVFPEGSGGVERQILEVYGRIASTGHAEIDLVSLGTGPPAKHELAPGLTLRRVPRTSLLGLTGAQVSYSFQVWNAAWEEFRTFRPHVIHANTLFYATSLTAAWIGTRTQTPVVLTAHIGELSSLSQPYRALSSAYEQSVGRVLVSKSARVICIGNSVRDHIQSLGGESNRSVVIPNGVDSDRFRPPAEPVNNVRPVIVSVGRLIFNKGNQYLVRAAHRLTKRGLDFELWIVGDGPMRAKLEDLAGSLISSGHVRFLGRRDDVPELLARADIFVRASLTESMPMGVLEAMAVGLPAIATDVGSTKEAITNRLNGMLVPPRSVRKLESAMAELLEDETLRRQIGAAARVRACELDWESVAVRTLEVFKEASRIRR